MGDAVLTPTGRDRTRAAREAYRAKYASSAEQASAHFAELARRRRGRLDLTPEETMALLQAVEILQRAAQRAREKTAQRATEGGGR